MKLYSSVSPFYASYGAGAGFVGPEHGFRPPDPRVPRNSSWSFTFFGSGGVLRIGRVLRFCRNYEKKCLTYREGYSIFSFVGNMQHARVAQRWSTSLPRRGSRVRSPSRALEYKNRYPFGYLFFCIRDTSVSQSSIVYTSLRSVQYRGSTFHFGRCWANVPRTFSTPGPRAPSPAFFIF